MDSTQVTERQATELAERIGTMTGFLTRLYGRMQQRGWMGGDVLFEDVRRAQEAMHRLHLTLREIARLRHASKASASGRRPWEPGGSGRSGGG
jgi:hypothetical protein